ncbi:MAG: family permease [Paenibacillaceae bacterium]|nr:family permease [Paenibacillaceae bacterium]
MNGPMIVTLTTLAAASALFISGKIRADLVAVAALIVLMLAGVLKPEEALAGFSNSVVVMMIGLFVVGGGIFRTGLAKQVSRKLLQLAGTNETKLMLMVMLATASIGAFVSNTGTVAVMMPIVVSLAYSAETTPGRLLMPLAFASSLGGMLTSIGTPPNLVIQEALRSGGYGELKFFSFAPTGAICLVTGILAMLYLRRFLPKNEGVASSKGRKRSTGELEHEYRLAEHLLRVQVLKDSPLLDKTLLELRIPSRFQLTVIEIRRKISPRNQFFKTINQEVAGPESIIQEEDILYVLGPREDVSAFAGENGLVLLDSGEQVVTRESQRGAYATSDMGLAELMLTPKSRLIGKLVKESGFREKYRLNVLGIQRKDQYILHQVKEEKMRFGDALLVQGTWEDISLLASTASEVIVVGQPLEESRKITMDRKAPIAAGILLLLIVLLVTEWVPAVTAVMIAAVLTVALGCIRGMEEAYRAINWESIVLIGGMIPMSTAIEKTGAAELLSSGLVNSLGQFGPMALLAGVYITTSILTMFISNTACAVLLAPIALAAATQFGANPHAYLFAVSIGASMCFASPFSTPPNALVMSAGRYKFSHYLKVGLPLQILMGIVMIIALPLIYPF